MVRTAESILDEWLVLRCQSGETNALSELLTRWHDRLVARARMLLHHEADAADAVQEAMIGIAKSMHRLDDPALFGPWAFRILANKCADAIKRQRRKRTIESEFRESGQSVIEPTIEQDGQAGVRLALDLLSAEMQALLTMKYGQEMSIEQIAAALGIREGTVKSRLHHARNELKSILDRLEQ